jgi:hypothetical protein
MALLKTQKYCRLKEGMEEIFEKIFIFYCRFFIILTFICQSLQWMSNINPNHGPFNKTGLLKTFKGNRGTEQWPVL